MLWSVWSEEEPSLQIMLSRNAPFQAPGHRWSWYFNRPLIFMNRMSPDFKISLNLVAYAKRKEGFFWRQDSFKMLEGNNQQNICCHMPLTTQLTVLTVRYKRGYARDEIKSVACACVLVPGVI
jgi:hypothetical protein